MLHHSRCKPVAHAWTSTQQKGFVEVFRSGYLRRTLGVKVLICLDAVCPLVDFIWFYYLWAIASPGTEPGMQGESWYILRRASTLLVVCCRCENVNSLCARRVYWQTWKLVLLSSMPSQRMWLIMRKRPCTAISDDAKVVFDRTSCWKIDSRTRLSFLLLAILGFLPSWSIWRFFGWTGLNRAILLYQILSHFHSFSVRLLCHVFPHGGW